MVEKASIARPYAKAVFELAQETSSFDEWSHGLNQLAMISDNQEFNQLANDPRVDQKAIVELLIELGGDKLPKTANNFVQLLIKNDRLDALINIKQIYEELVANAQSMVTAEVVTALPLKKDQKSALQNALEARLGLKVSLEETVDANLIGGAIVKAGDLVIDGSAKGRIDKLSTTLLR